MRSLLFVPGDSERKIEKGFGSAADALILDLEDAVAIPKKDLARALCADVLRTARNGKSVIVRINAFETPFALQDLADIIKGKPDGIMLPKCQSLDDVARLITYLDILEIREGIEPGAIAIYPIVTETARSVLALSDYRKPMARIKGLLWGGEDLAADIGALANRDRAGHYTSLFASARSLCLLAAAALEAEAIDAVNVNFRDLDALRLEAEQAAQDGFSAKAAIHPDQIDVINQAFTPSAEAVSHAKAILEAFKQSDSGVASLNGRMIDAPHLRSARKILHRNR
ncbi:MAG: CoA ester lyase [Alphaproteobacteria bacterium]|nr:CoA ester lyase [Alphaproteobacteria bacterium]